MSAMGMKAKQDAFNARLKRIEARGANTSGKIYVGEGGSVDGRKAVKAKNIVARTKKDHRSLSTKLGGLLFTILLGVVAVLAARIAIFHWFGISFPLVDPVKDLRNDAALALSAGVLLAMTFGTVRKGHFFGLLLGLVLGLGMAHNLVHLQPDLFAKATSPAWVASVQASSMPRSIIFLDRMMLF